MTERTVCDECGVTSVSYPERRLGETTMVHIDYKPTTFVINLKAETRTTYIVTPEVERLAARIRSLDSGALHYAVDVPLWDSGNVANSLRRDERIESWYTEESAPICDSHCHIVRC